MCRSELSRAATTPAPDSTATTKRPSQRSRERWADLMCERASVWFNMQNIVSTRYSMVFTPALAPGNQLSVDSLNRIETDHTTCWSRTLAPLEGPRQAGMHARTHARTHVSKQKVEVALVENATSSYSKPLWGGLSSLPSHEVEGTGLPAARNPPALTATRMGTRTRHHQRSLISHTSRR